MDWFKKRVVSSLIVALSYWVLITWRVWWGRSGRGATILEGEIERPFGMEELLMRRELVSEDEREEDWRDAEVEEQDLVLPLGMSRMFSLRPVVGSVV